MDKQYYYSEIFHSAQGEGMFTGVPGPWLRYFMCNLQCNGFGQDDPTNPDTYKLPYEDINVNDYNSLEELPVFQYGCDSSYSWAKKYKRFAHKATPRQIVDRLYDSMKNEHNPMGLFCLDPDTGGYHQHLHITGGEPLLPKSQECTTELINLMLEDNNFPSRITFETNGTKELKDPFIEAIQKIPVHWSISPKLWNTAGEKSERAFKPEVIKSYQTAMPYATGMLKFVCDGRKESWQEIQDKVYQLRRINVNYPVSIMPVGATVEGQKLCDSDVASEAVARGFHVSARVHTYIWGNVIGV